LPSWSRHACRRQDPHPSAAVAAATLSRNAGEGRETIASKKLPRPHRGEGWGEGANSGEPLAVYIHWPFCRSKCPYCDFNSHVRDSVDDARWTRALVADLDFQAPLASERTVGSIFFGGGTPSLMPAETVAVLVAQVKALWPVAGDLEVTLEANPNSAEAEHFSAFADAGVNRLSLGVQSLDPEALRFLGRGHDRAEAITAIALARARFPRFSFDLIYARPGQSLAAWDAELDAALALAGEHLSLYQLTIEEGTAFGNRAARGEALAADEDTAALLFEATQQRLAAAGLPAYEISNHARVGAECRHNLAYWRYQDYLGIGPGAHGRITRDGRKLATQQQRSPEAWLAAIEENGAGFAEMTPIARETAADEMLMMGLRLVEGVSRRRLEDAAGRDLGELFGDRLNRLVDGGFLALDGDRLAATPAGRQRLNAVLAALLA
jgi:putative oxygen-independent coproporphyrinogen III oxidase